MGGVVSYMLITGGAGRFLLPHSLPRTYPYPPALSATSCTGRDSSYIVIPSGAGRSLLPRSLLRTRPPPQPPQHPPPPPFHQALFPPKGNQPPTDLPSTLLKPT